MGKVYSVPRRYDLATMFVVSVAFALLFSALSIFNVSPITVGMLTLLVGVVAGAQAILFQGRHPRLASAIAGITFCGVWWLIVAWTRQNIVPTRPTGLPYLVIFQGSLLGYFSGTLIAGVFLVSDIVRTAGRRWRFGPCQRTPNGGDDLLEFDELSRPGNHE